jgi:hypothetical protein
MSYARFGEGGSDVYLFAHVGGFVQCCGCVLLRLADDFDSPSVNLTSAESVVSHLREHVTAGHHVEEGLLDPKLYPADDFVVRVRSPRAQPADPFCPDQRLLETRQS